jgi:peptide/nickel transport system substrate-binding protein
MPRHRIALAALAAILLGAPVTPTRAQDLTIGSRQGPESMDPHFSPTVSHAGAVRNVYDTLVRRRPNMDLVPWLAESWRTTAPTTWEFKLRRGVAWHDGSPFTARDVKFSIERIPTIASGSGGTQAYVKSVRAVEVIDDHTVLIHTKEPAPTLLVDLDRVFMVSEMHAKGADNQTFREGGAAVGTGPYKYVRHVPRSELVLERNDAFWGQRPHWRRVVFREIPNDNARVAALLAGDVDLINATPTAAVAQLERAPDVTLTRARSSFVFLVHPDHREPSPQVFDNAGNPLAKNPFRDRRVREALSLSIDRENLARVVTEGLALPAHWPMNMDFPGTPRDPPPAPLVHDPARARALLAEAGYPQGFRVRLNCTNDRLPNDGKICQALGQMFARIGVQAEVFAQPGTVYLPAFTRGEFSLAMSAYGTITGEANYILSQLLFTRDKVPNMGSFNRTRYSNPEVDQIALAANAEMDEAKRRALLERGMRLVMSEFATIPVAHPMAIWAMNARKVRYEARVDEETHAAEVMPVTR